MTTYLFCSAKSPNMQRRAPWAWLFMMDEAALAGKEPFHGGVVALDETIAPLSADVRIVAVIDLAGHTSAGLCLVGTDCTGPVQAHPRSLALLRKPLAAFASCHAVRRKPTIWPLASTARHR